MAIDTTGPRTRRAVLGAALGALAATVATALGRPATTRAADGDPVLLGTLNTTTRQTSIHTANDAGLVVTSASQPGVWGISNTAVGVVGTSFDGPGVQGRSNTAIGVAGISLAGVGVKGTRELNPAIPGSANGGIGVEGQADTLHGIGIYGHADATSSETYGVLGFTKSPLGRGVFGWSQATSGGTGAWGQSDGATGVGVRGYAWDGQGASGSFGTGVLGSSGSHAFPPPPPRKNTGVMGVAPGGTGIYGSGARGAVLAGTTAQLQLTASTAVSHPTSGARGDLFVDRSGRLWFCKGGASWKQLA